MAEDLPYRAEYSKSNRAACKGCKEKIEKDILRLAVMVRSPFFDGKQPNWFHFMCFFGRQRPKNVGDIAHFDSLRWEDQEKIKKKIESLAGTAAPPEANGKKAPKRTKSSSSDVPNLKDYTIQYSKSNRATCRGCEMQIAKDEVRVSKKDFESEEALRYGGLDRWHHLECFAKVRAELGFFECGSILPGFKTLDKDDQKAVKKTVPKIKVKKESTDEVDAEIPTKKIKEDPEVAAKTQKLKKQNDLMFFYRDSLKKLHKNELTSLLEFNEQEIPEGMERILDRLSDAMAFGTLLPCEHCKAGQLVFRSNVGYQCIGDVNEWAKCQKVFLKPKRKAFKCPEELKDKYSFLKKYKVKPSERVFEIRESTASVKLTKAVKEELGPKVDRFAPLKHMSFVLMGKFSKPSQELKQKIIKLGGHVVSDITNEVAAVISSQDELDKMKLKMQEAQSEGIQVVPESFIEEASKGDAMEKIVKLNIASWGQDPKVRIERQTKKNIMKSQMSGKSKFLSSGPSKVKLKMKAGIVVDPDSGLEDVAHVYAHHGSAYTSILGLTDIQSDKNSYYKLQILEADSSKRYWLFRSWGRIGTSIGGTKLEDFKNVENAIKKFEELYEERTGNLWCNRKHFVKVPGRMYPIDIDYGNEEEEKLSTKSNVESKLSKPVQELIKLLFDVNMMKKLMLEFELDLEKMPLGKLSRKQISEAYGSLNKIQVLLQEKSPDDPKKFEIIAETNKFYTLIPHNFGVDSPPPIDNQDLLKQKIEMLDSLMEIELAYSLLKSGKEETKENVHPLDQHFAKLNSDIETLDKASDEYKVIKKYVKNTHAVTHNLYKLEIDEVFKVKRSGEDKRYEPFKNLHNRKLLWHGSRLTNFAGILSQGLRIAPPEAPTTGYMFGKGIYFADMVSKSANYCMPSPINSQGLLLLCQVALGDMLKCKEATYITKLPKGNHSCMGVGQTAPNPAKTYKRSDGVEVPLGEGAPTNEKNSALLYNEFIVYDVAQVKVEYLVKMKFKFD